MKALRERVTARRVLLDVPRGGVRAITLSAVLHNKRALCGAIPVAAVLALTLLSLVWTPYDPIAAHAGPAFTAPSWRHLAGTDVYGRDILSRIMAGSQASIAVACIAVMAAAVMGSVIGVVSGFVGGKVDLIATRVVDLMLAIPALVFALGIVALLGPSAQSVAVALSVVYMWQFARVIRSIVISVRNKTYVEASRGLGVPAAAIIAKDIFPSVVPILVVQITTALAWGILDEANLGFLGLGVQPPSPSWGSLLIEGREYLYDAPWLPLGAGTMVVIAVLGVNLLGDGLRDIIDPRTGEK
ncbi:ABC transporter permease [Nostocoides sp. HKS02]|uniref:ABC transporter permease n=1 Tax=Nostocoides sp. HKS02 TaxID=1813880 RepID=UPI0018A87036|nr:ABC transporter permease [Tetrasphaera sp. HKS02]